MEAMAGHMEKLTGHRPETCPWRAMYDPLVADIHGIVALKDYGDAALGDDPPALHLDALRVYLRARGATEAHDLKQEREAREREHKLELQRMKQRQ